MTKVEPVPLFFPGMGRGGGSLLAKIAADFHRAAAYRGRMGR